jgi:hypothetical protein
VSDRETPGDGDEFGGWRLRWTSRRRPYFATVTGALPTEWDRRLTEIAEPVLVLAKPGRKWVEVKGQSEVDRPVMQAKGMSAALLCEAEFSRQWGDEAAALRFTAEAERWHRISKVRANANAVQRVGARMIAGPAGAGAKGV